MFDFTNEEILLRGMMNRGNEMKVFDWDRAAQLIKDRKPKEAIAGLSEDWFWTARTIFFDGKPVIHGGTYLASTWATPYWSSTTARRFPAGECRAKLRNGMPIPNGRNLHVRF